MARMTVVVSQGQSANPIKRKLEEDLVAELLGVRGVEVVVVPHLYDLKSDGTAMLCLNSIAGDCIVLSWLYPRAAFWTLDRRGIRGQFGASLLKVEGESDEDEGDEEADADAPDDKARVADERPAPNRKIFCVDLRARETVAPFVDEIRRIVAEQSVQTFDLLSFGTSNGNGAAPAAEKNGAEKPTAEKVVAEKSVVEKLAERGIDVNNPLSADDIGGPVRIEESAARRWYPVIDYSRCTNCLECIDFCLFGVYGVDGAETILVEQPDNCRKGCPACSRVCPENAIIFPQHKTPAIAGSDSGEAGGLKIDLSKLFGAPDPLEVAVLERDVELVAVGRDAVGDTVGMPKRRDQEPERPKDDLDKLMDRLEELDL